MEANAPFVYLTGSYSHRFTCKANGYKIHFYKGRAHLVKDEESIKELRANPFYQEVGVDVTTTGRPDKPAPEPVKKTAKKKIPKLSKAVESKET